MANVARVFEEQMQGDILHPMANDRSSVDPSAPWEVLPVGAMPPMPRGRLGHQACLGRLRAGRTDDVPGPPERREFLRLCLQRSKRSALSRCRQGATPPLRPIEIDRHDRGEAPSGVGPGIELRWN